MKDAFSELCPASKKQVSGPASSSGSEWDVAHVNHSGVAAWTLDGKTGLGGGLSQLSHQPNASY